VDDEFLKDMEAPEAANATIMIQALFRRNKFLANKFLKSQRPEPPAVPRCAPLPLKRTSVCEDDSAWTELSCRGGKLSCMSRSHSFLCQVFTQGPWVG